MLLAARRPDHRLVLGEAWRPLLAQFSADQLHDFDGIVIGGGPGYQRHMVPNVYPLAPLGQLPVPVVPLALGTYIFPGSGRATRSYSLGSPTLEFLRWVRAHAHHLGARDELTAALLARHGLGGVVMTGDPAWYDPDQLDLDIRKPTDVRSVAFTPPATPTFQNHGLELLSRLVDEFAGGVQVVVHRDPQPIFAAAADRLGLRLDDISGSSAGFAHYDEVDAHIGYRLHAHLYCLSRGIPSYLVAEDSRGVGALETLGAIGINPFRNGMSVPRQQVAAAVLKRLLPRDRNLNSLFARVLLSQLRYEPASSSIFRQIAGDLRTGWVRHEAARRIVRATYPQMLAMIDALPLSR